MRRKWRAAVVPGTVAGLSSVRFRECFPVIRSNREELERVRELWIGDVQQMALLCCCSRSIGNGKRSAVVSESDRVIRHISYTSETKTECPFHSSILFTWMDRSNDRGRGRRKKKPRARPSHLLVLPMFDSPAGQSVPAGGQKTGQTLTVQLSELDLSYLALLLNASFVRLFFHLLFLTAFHL